MLDKYIRLSHKISQFNKLTQRLKLSGMSQFNLKGEQTLIMALLLNHPEGITFKQLQFESQLDRAYISRNLKLLREMDLIEKSGTEKQKNSLFKLSPEGIKTASEIAVQIQKVEEQADLNISEKDLEIFYKVLNQINDNLEHFPEDWS